MRYEKPPPEQWIQPVRKGYRLACCDCGLVHELEFRVHRGKIQFRGRRHARATAQIRRWMEAK